MVETRGESEATSLSGKAQSKVGDRRNLCRGMSSSIVPLVPFH